MHTYIALMKAQNVESMLEKIAAQWPPSEISGRPAANDIEVK